MHILNQLKDILVLLIKILFYFDYLLHFQVGEIMQIII
jgi:hypothetical protein